MTTQPAPQLNDSDLELLSAYIDSQLTSDERLALEVRLLNEPALRMALDELRATVSILRDLEPIRPPRSFTIDPATVQQPAATGWWNWMRIFQVAGSLAVVFACAFISISVMGGAGGGAGVPMSAAAPTIAPFAATRESAAGSAPAAPMTANEPEAALPEPTAAPAATSAPQPTPAPATYTAASEAAPQSLPPATAPPPQSTPEAAIMEVPATPSVMGTTVPPAARQTTGEEPTVAAAADQALPAQPPLPATSAPASAGTTQLEPAGSADAAQSKAEPSLTGTLVVGIGFVCLLVVGVLFAVRRRQR